jgi:hypothetical protein
MARTFTSAKWATQLRKQKVPGHHAQGEQQACRQKVAHAGAGAQRGMVTRALNTMTSKLPSAGTSSGHME